MLSDIYAKRHLCWVPLKLSFANKPLMLNDIYAECHYAECLYAECCDAI